MERVPGLPLVIGIRRTQYQRLPGKLDDIFADAAHALQMLARSRHEAQTRLLAPIRVTLDLCRRKTPRFATTRFSIAWFRWSQSAATARTEEVTHGVYNSPVGVANLVNHVHLLSGIQVSLPS